MNWEKIDIHAIIELLRQMENESIVIGGEHAVIYSDGDEEIKISYKNY